VRGFGIGLPRSWWLRREGCGTPCRRRSGSGTGFRAYACRFVALCTPVQPKSWGPLSRPPPPPRPFSKPEGRRRAPPPGVPAGSPGPTVPPDPPDPTSRTLPQAFLSEWPVPRLLAALGAPSLTDAQIAVVTTVVTRVFSAAAVASDPSDDAVEGFQRAAQAPDFRFRRLAVECAGAALRTAGPPQQPAAPSPTCWPCAWGG